MARMTSQKEKGRHYNRVCPNCGKGHFRVIPNKLSWLIGQKTKCYNCNYVFRKPWTEKTWRSRRKVKQNKRK